MIMTRYRDSYNALYYLTNYGKFMSKEEIQEAKEVIENDLTLAHKVTELRGYICNNDYELFLRLFGRAQDLENYYETHINKTDIEKILKDIQNFLGVEVKENV